MQMKLTYLFLILNLLIISLNHFELKSCTALIAGKNTTVDGSILFAKSEDDNEHLDYYWYIPRKNHDGNTFLLETDSLKIPQVGMTYGYFWDQSPKMMFSNVLINEWGVAFGSNGCRSKEDPVKTLEERGDIIDGGIGFRLRFILAERCKTAKEAVLLAAELISRYGYNASGRCLNIVDPDEAWQLQMVCGKHFVARRVQDDEVAIIANTFSIREVNLKDTESFICSPDIIIYAIKRGWYNPETDGEFDFAEAYATDNYHKADRNTHRAWISAHLVQRNLPFSIEDAENGKMPVSVKPDRKLSIHDMMMIFRNHFENTDLCKYLDQNISPHYVRDNNPICNNGTHKVNIIQQRNWLPAELGTVNWRALGNPCQSVFIPWYLGVNKIPETYQLAYEDPNLSAKDLIMYHFMGPDWQMNDIDLKSASAVFRLLNSIGDSRYFENQPVIRETFNRFESDLLAHQPEIEKEALNIYQIDKNKAKSFLTNYSNSTAMKGFDLAKSLITEFLN